MIDRIVRGFLFVYSGGIYGEQTQQKPQNAEDTPESVNETVNNSRMKDTLSWM